MENNSPDKKPSDSQMVWGVLLALMGVAVFLKIQQITPELRSLERWESVMPFGLFSLYLLGALLVGGGLKKIWTQLKLKKSKGNLPEDRESE